MILNNYSFKIVKKNFFEIKNLFQEQKIVFMCKTKRQSFKAINEKKTIQDLFNFQSSVELC